MLTFYKKLVYHENTLTFYTIITMEIIVINYFP